MLLIALPCLMEEVILVDEHDWEIGSGEKLQIRQEGKLHRAFSVLVFNRKQELLLQKTAILILALRVAKIN